MNSKRRHGSIFGNIGGGMIHGPSFVNIYHNPVINTKRANSRGPVRRKIKKGQLASGDEIGMTDRSGASGVFNPPNNYNTIQPIE